MSRAENTQIGPLGDWTGRLTLLGAELVYFGLAVYLTWITFTAQGTTTPAVSGAVSGATGALAAAFGVGYAAVLGVEASDGSATREYQGFAQRIAPALNWLGAVLSLKSLLGFGVVLYMVSGGLLGITYLAHSDQSPAVVHTIAIAFGGYVISYIGLVYKQYAG